MRCRNRVLITLLGWIITSATAMADEDSSPEGTRSQSQQGVLIFRSGRVLEGRFTETESHYVVLRRVGKIQVSKGQVEKVCKNLEEAFRYKAARINDRDPDELLRLAQWCILVNLHHHAIELLEQLADHSREPNRVAAMLRSARRLQVSQGPGSGAGGNRSPRQVKGEQIEQVRLPFALSPNVVRRFTLQVQPLLLRSCARAGCHGAGHDGPLVLHRAARPNRKTTQRNLQAVLALIDREAPDQSPLLVSASRAHGNSRRPPLLGARVPAYNTLAGWIKLAAGRPGEHRVSETGSADQLTSVGVAAHASDDSLDLAPEDDPGKVLTGPKSPAALLGDTTEQAAGRSLAGPLGTSAVQTASEPQNSKRSTAAPPGSSTGRRPENTAKFRPIDPFDPEIFNRRFAP